MRRIGGSLRGRGGRGAASRAPRHGGWALHVRFAAVCAAVLLTMLLAVDAVAAGLTPARTALWTALSVLLFVVLVPPKVTAGETSPGSRFLVSRGLLHERRVRMDRLMSVRWADGVAQRIVLRDTDGGRVELDPRVLVADPPLWLLLDEGGRTSRADGLLLCGADVMRELAERLEREMARNVFEVSGLQ
ncbi:hypothetical protein ACWD0A_13090 [Streptomyces sp. NPDC002867]